MVPRPLGGILAPESPPGGSWPPLAPGDRLYLGATAAAPEGIFVSGTASLFPPGVWLKGRRWQEGVPGQTLETPCPPGPQHDPSLNLHFSHLHNEANSVVRRSGEGQDLLPVVPQAPSIEALITPSPISYFPRNGGAPQLL